VGIRPHALVLPRLATKEKTHQSSTPSAPWTLIEVLVCIAGLALLLGQAVPVARQARSDAQLATCLSRLGEITRASAVYSAQDPDETAIPIGERDATSTDAVYSHFNFGGKSGTSTALYPFLLASVFSGNNAMNASRRPLNRILYKQAIPEPDDTCGYTFCMDWSPGCAPRSGCLPLPRG
jgi:hypothetical protein